LKNLKFPDGYAGFRRAVNLESGKVSGVKSHDYHIFMERLLPVTFFIFLSYYDFDEYSLVLVLNRMSKRLKSVTKKLLGGKVVRGWQPPFFRVIEL
jgi:hypothetical protein